MKQKTIFLLLLVITISAIGLARQLDVVPASADPFDDPGTCIQTAQAIPAEATRGCLALDECFQPKTDSLASTADDDFPLSPISRFILLQ